MYNNNDSISAQELLEFTNFVETKPEAPPLPSGLYSMRLEPELKDICRRLHLRLSGRKSEVLGRIEHAWKCNNPGVRELILGAKELHSSPIFDFSSHQRTPSVSVAGPGGGGSGSSSSSSSSLPPVKVTLTNGGNIIASTSLGGVHHPNNVLCCCNSRHMASPMVRCCECGSLLHPSCVQVHSSEASTKSYVCALCRAVCLDPFLPIVLEKTWAQLAGAPAGVLEASARHGVAAYRQQYSIRGASQTQISGIGQPNTCYMDFELSSHHIHELLLGKRLEVRSGLANSLMPCLLLPLPANSSHSCCTPRFPHVLSHSRVCPFDAHLCSCARFLHILATENATIAGLCGRPSRSMACALAI